MTNKQWIFWVDDMRNPEDYFTKEDFEKFNILWIKTFEGFKFYVKHMDLPSRIYLDHDLGEKESGYDCIKYLADYCIKNDITEMPAIYSQSQNPVGRANIFSVVNSFHKFNETYF